MIWHNGKGYVILLLISVSTANNLQIPRVKYANRAVLPEGGRETGRSDRVLMKYDGTDDQARLFGESLGWTWKRKVLSRYEFTVSTRGPEYELTELRKIDKNVKYVEYEDFLNREKRVVTINDAEWANQWNLKTSQTPSMNVYNAWDKGFSGSGVTIAIVDDGIDVDHTDLVNNYVSSLSYDYIYDVADPSHFGPYDGHGSNCAGVAGAVKNSLCVIGVAYESSLPAIRILDDTYTATSSDEAMALTHGLSSVDIYSNSWGPSDDGETFSALPSVVAEALEKGVTQGRDGKGAIYTWAAGNGEGNYDDCNADGYASSMYTIAIAAVAQDAKPAYYSEHCAAILASTYSGGDGANRDIYTTGPSNTCVNDFSGTSAACPVASGILALTLEANSALTWRDIQHMIVEHSATASLHSDAGFYTNGAGKLVSHKLGFGLMDAEAMVDNAPSWQTVPSRTSCYTGLSSVQKYSYATAIADSITATDCFISYLEHVIVEISYEAFWRGDVQFNLLSPSGTNTIIFRSRSYDSSASKTTVEFTSVHTWGEDPNGVWTLTMSDTWGTTTMNLYYWSLTFYGTVTDPLAGEPTAGTLGGSCTTTTDCSGVTDGGCLEDALVCVSCTGNYRLVGDFCKQDGRLGGYCSASLTCWQDTLQCVDNVCKTVSEEESETNIALIAGIVVASLVGVSLLASLCFFIYKKFLVPKSRVAPSSSGHYPSTRNTGHSSRPGAYPSGAANNVIHPVSSQPSPAYDSLNNTASTPPSGHYPSTGNTGHSSRPGAYPSGSSNNVFYPDSSQPPPAYDSLFNMPSAPPPPPYYSGQPSTNTVYPVQHDQPYTISGSENSAFQQ